MASAESAESRRIKRRLPNVRRPVAGFLAVLAVALGQVFVDEHGHEGESDHAESSCAACVLAQLELSPAPTIPTAIADAPMSPMVKAVRPQLVAKERNTAYQPRAPPSL